MGGGVLGCLELAQRFGNVAGDFIGMDFGRFDDAFGIDDEGTAQCQTLFLDVHSKGVREGVGRIANQGKFRLAYGRGSFVPDLVREMRVGGDDVDFRTHLLEFGVVVGRVFDFGWAVECKCGRHENEDRPFAFKAFIGNGNEFSVVEGLGFKWLNGGINERHGAPFWVKNNQRQGEFSRLLTHLSNELIQ